jgi:hypothetical protein
LLHHALLHSVAVFAALSHCQPAPPDLDLLKGKLLNMTEDELEQYQQQQTDELEKLHERECYSSEEREHSHAELEEEQRFECRLRHMVHKQSDLLEELQRKLASVTDDELDAFHEQEAKKLVDYQDSKCLTYVQRERADDELEEKQWFECRLHRMLQKGESDDSETESSAAHAKVVIIFQFYEIVSMFFFHFRCAVFLSAKGSVNFC